MKGLILYRLLRMAIILLLVAAALWIMSRFFPYMRYPMKVTFASALISGFVSISIGLISFVARYMSFSKKPFLLTAVVVLALIAAATYLFTCIDFGELYRYQDPYSKKTTNKPWFRF